MHFGRRAKERRIAQRLSVAELARIVGCAEATIWGIEAEQRMPSLRLARRIADALGVSLDHLTQGEP